VPGKLSDSQRRLLLWFCPEAGLVDADLLRPTFLGLAYGRAKGFLILLFFAFPLLLITNAIGRDWPLGFHAVAGLIIAIVSGPAHLLVIRKRVRVAIWKVMFEHGVPICPTCGYSMKGLSATACPECGTSA
jgi:ribosomal protein L32